MKQESSDGPMLMKQESTVAMDVQQDDPLVTKIMGAILEWSLRCLLDSVIFEEAYCGGILARGAEWGSVVELLHAQIVNVKEEQGLELAGSLL